jgi:transcriptional regulator with GAF, ATPase, and Fis domain
MAPTVVLPRPDGSAVPAPDRTGTTSGTVAEGLLADALQQLGSVLDERQLRLNEALQSVLAGTHRALGLRTTVLCLRDPHDGTISGRIGLGAADPSVFRIRPQAAGDLFAALLAKGADLHVADSRTVAAKLPPWYRRQVDAGSFVLLPLMVKGSAVGLLYLDKAEPGGLHLGEREIELLRALRDRLLSAFERGV